MGRPAERLPRPIARGDLSPAGPWSWPIAATPRTPPRIPSKPPASAMAGRRRRLGAGRPAHAGRRAGGDPRRVASIRTTDVAGGSTATPAAELGFLVAEFDLDELRTLDAGSWFLDPAGPPRSARAWFGTLGRLGEARSPPVRLGRGAGADPGRGPGIDRRTRLAGQRRAEVVSPAMPGLLDAVLDVGRRDRHRRRVLISSFDHADVARCVRRRDETSASRHGRPRPQPLHRPERYVREAVGAYAYHPSPRSSAAQRGLSSAPAPRTLRRAKCSRP